MRVTSWAGFLAKLGLLLLAGFGISIGVAILSLALNEVLLVVLLLVLFLWRFLGLSLSIGIKGPLTIGPYCCRGIIRKMKAKVAVFGLALSGG